MLRNFSKLTKVKEQRTIISRDQTVKDVKKSFHGPALYHDPQMRCCHNRNLDILRASEENSILPCQLTDMHGLQASFLLFYVAKLRNTRREPRESPDLVRNRSPRCRDGFLKIARTWKGEQREILESQQGIPARNFVPQGHYQSWIGLWVPLPRVWTRWMLSRQYSMLEARLKSVTRRKWWHFEMCLKCNKELKDVRKWKKFKCQDVMKCITRAESVVSWPSHWRTSGLT